MGDVDISSANMEAHQFNNASPEDSSPAFAFLLVLFHDIQPRWWTVQPYNLSDWLICPPIPTPAPVDLGSTFHTAVVLIVSVVVQFSLFIPSFQIPSILTVWIDEDEASCVCSVSLFIPCLSTLQALEVRRWGNLCDGRRNLLSSRHV